MNLSVIHHVAIIVSNYKESRNFYVNQLLGLSFSRFALRFSAGSRAERFSSGSLPLPGGKVQSSAR